MTLPLLIQTISFVIFVLGTMYKISTIEYGIRKKIDDTGTLLVTELERMRTLLALTDKESSIREKLLEQRLANLERELTKDIATITKRLDTIDSCLNGGRCNFGTKPTTP